MNVLSLFAGIGGFDLGLERAGMRVVAQVEIDPFCQKVLAKHWPDVPCYSDIRELTYERLEADGIIDVGIITGGFPCQDISHAGHQAGIGKGTRSGLWSEFARLIGEIRPRYAIVENVTALLAGDSGRWFGRVLGDLAQIGYDAEWHCIQPEFVGIPSYRDRVWICAYPSQKHAEEVVVTPRLSLKPRRVGSADIPGAGWSVDQCDMGRGSNGIPDRVDRFECLGNSIVPAISECIGRAIMAADQ